MGAKDHERVVKGLCQSLNMFYRANVVSLHYQSPPLVFEE